MSVDIVVPASEFPELIVTVPDGWPCVKIAPLYDVHLGHSLHATDTFLRHIEWLKSEPYLLSFNGGDLIENAIQGSPGILTGQKVIPDEQFDAAVAIIEPFRDKLLFAIPGNHEARSMRMCGFDIAKHLARECNKLAYFPDYVFVTIKWKGQNFKLVCHHGTGAAQTPGGQRNAARKDLPWIGGADIFWTGHLHQPIVDLVYRTDYEQSTGRMVTRQCFVIVSPSYLKYFGGYAAAKRLAPGVLGLTVVTLRADGRMDAEIHSQGKRL